MKVLVVGASGATGRLLVENLLERGHGVKAVVRSSGRLPEAIQSHANLSLIERSLLAMSDSELAELVEGCDAIASCLGHNMTFKGMYGKPRRLVTDATRRLCDAAKVDGPGHPTKFVLMNTAGNQNRDIDERVSLGQRVVVGLLRHLLPPHADNEQAADYLRTEQSDQQIQWVVVRPDSLIDESAVTDYEIHPSPTRNPIFDPGKTSRINVGHFMADLLSDDDAWKKWQGQMPVIYNKNS